MVSIVGLLVAATLIGAVALRPWDKVFPATPVTFGNLPANGFTLGSTSAPVTIDIYEDFQCPICLEWYQRIFPSLRDGALASGEAKLVFHDTSALGPESVAAARAAWAAQRQGRFWDMWSALYSHQGPTENSGAFSDAALRALAAELGLDMGRYDADFASSAAADFVTASETDSHTAGITGTPTLVIAGVQHQGVGTYADLVAVIDAARSGVSPAASR
jgi:protein-disulfide isomerase